MPDDRHRTHERIGRPLATGGTKALFCKITLFCRSRAGAVKPRPPLDDLSPFDSIFLILRRVGVCTRIDPTLLLAGFPRSSPSSQTASPIDWCRIWKTH